MHDIAAGGSIQAPAIAVSTGVAVFAPVILIGLPALVPINKVVDEVV